VRWETGVPGPSRAWEIGVPARDCSRRLMDLHGMRREFGGRGADSDALNDIILYCINVARIMNRRKHRGLSQCRNTAEWLSEHAAANPRTTLGVPVPKFLLSAELTRGLRFWLVVLAGTEIGRMLLAMRILKTQINQSKTQSKID